MNDLEDTVKKLCESFDKFRSENKASKAVEKTFADIANSGLGAVQRNRANQVMNGPPNIHVTGPPLNGYGNSWAAEMNGQPGQGFSQGGHLGRGLQPGGRVGAGAGRSVSPKRSREESENDGSGGQANGQF